MPNPDDLIEQVKQLGQGLLNLPAAAGRLAVDPVALHDILSSINSNNVDGIPYSGLIKSMMPGNQLDVMTAALPFIHPSLVRGMEGAEALEGSKVISQSGRLTPVYHGTPNVFGELDTSFSKPGLFGKGLYFTENPDIASGYSRIENSGVAPNVRPSYLSIENPFRADRVIDEAGPEAKAATKWLEDHNYDGDYLLEKLNNQEANGYNILGEDLYRHAAKTENLEGQRLGKEGARKMLEDLGYDGITHIGNGPPQHRVWIAFKNSQVHSALDVASKVASGHRMVLP
jgi:hypothetical protein